MSRFVTVFGATGTQGSSVVDALLADGTFTPRAVTRNLDSHAAKKLKAKGAKVVRADIGDKESIKKAVAGSEGVFGVTSPYDPANTAGGNPHVEVEQGKNLIDACKEVGVKFFVWSSLPSAKIVSKGKFPNIHHFEDKVVVDEYLRSSGLPYANVKLGQFAHLSISTMYLKPLPSIGNFAENTYNFRWLIKTTSGTGYELRMPRLPITFTSPLVWVTKDLGPSVLALLKNYNDNKDILGQTFYIVSERITNAKFVEILEEVLGKPVTYKTIQTTGEPVIDDMWEFENQYGLYSDIETLPDPRLVALGVKFSTARAFVEEAVKPRFV